MYLIRGAAFACVFALFSALFSLPGWAELVLSQTHGSATHICSAGERVVIAGSGNTLRLSGPCGQIEIAGSENRVAMAQAEELHLTGNNNVVSWTGTRPVVHDAGSGNQLAGRAIMRGSHAPTTPDANSTPAPAPHL